MISLFAALLAQATSVGTVNAANPCIEFDQPAHASVAQPRKVSTRDLATLADIGRSDAYDSPTPLGVAPDGKRVAFEVRRANPDTNSYCQRLLIVSASGNSSPIEVDRGGEFNRDPLSIWGLTGLHAGWPNIVAPQWSPDGKTLAYLKRVADSTQVWCIDLATGGVHQATHLDVDVENFVWSTDGQALIVASRPGMIAARADIAREGKTGYLYDERFSPMQADYPLLRDNIATVYQRIDISSGGEVAASIAERRRLDDGADPDHPNFVHRYLKRVGGGAVWTQLQDPSRLISPEMLVETGRNGRRFECRDPACAEIRGLWWAPNNAGVYFEARVGWGKSQTGLFHWHPRIGSLKPILVTNDALVGCLLAGGRFICTREGSASTRKVVAIDAHSGKQTVLYDPNPAFSELDLGSVQRFRFRNAFGVECYADLVLPPDHKPGQRHPLVVAQYSSDGFLRGGTGDEVPIQALASMGFAVLSFNRPAFVPAAKAATTDVGLRSENRKQWIDRRSVESALETAVASAINTGTVDPDHMGISGLSDGTSTTQWALINSTLFKAAAIGSCCEDRFALPLNGGEGYAKFLRQMGYPAFDDADPKFWRPLSLSLNADRISAPLLIQASDAEYEIALDTIEAFRERGKAIDTYVFPDEVHFKWQPAHRLAMYDRVAGWFRFWLMHKIDCSSPSAKRWMALRGAPSASELECDSGGAPLP